MLDPNSILYEDNHLLILHKPHGLLTQSTSLVEDSLEMRAKTWVKMMYNKPFDVFLHPIHRLDKPASGIVVFAKTSKALSRLNQAMRDRKILKKYRIKTDSLPSFREGSLIHRLSQGHHKAHIDATGKRAELSFSVVDDEWISVLLRTGRYHQIRAQFSAIGCPVRGDVKYGSKYHCSRDAIDLHHVECSFPHPTQERLVVVKIA